MFARFHHLLAAGALALAAGCSFPPADVWMYVDNTGHEPLTVSVDGQEAATVAAGKFEVVKRPPGEHKIVIRRGDEVVFDGSKEFKAGEQFGMRRKYLLNPDGATRYAIYTAEYGSNPFKGALRSAIAGAVDNPPSQTQFAYHDLLKQVEPLPPHQFLDVGTTEYILTDPPESVRTKSFSERRTVLTRVQEEDHSALWAARDNKEPTEEDIANLEELCDRVMFTPQDD
jgi:hypothetical protein